MSLASGLDFGTGICVSVVIGYSIIGEPTIVCSSGCHWIQVVSQVEL